MLVSGAGQPRDERANPADNSTETAGRIIERFVRLAHPDIEVVHRATHSALPHRAPFPLGALLTGCTACGRRSSTSPPLAALAAQVVHIPSVHGIFRYDDNVRFVKEQVR